MALNDEMDAVLASGKADVDPVSGNEVPTGSLPEEVRDDVPANLSEGEYVVPADVVRFFGVKFFEDIRAEAKRGFSDMESNGRIGGDPVGMEMGDDELPFDLSELQMVEDGEPEMYKGGYVKGYNEGGLELDSNAINTEFPGTQVGAGTGTEEWRVFTNAEGMSMTIRFVNGKPVSAIPPGYTESGQTPADAVAPTVSRSNDDDDGPTAPPAETKPPTNWNKAGVDEFEKAMKFGGGLGKLAPTALGVINPLLGIGARLATNANNQRMIEGLASQIAGNKDLSDADRVKMEGFHATLLKNQTEANKDTKLGLVEKSGIYGGQSTMLEKLEDRDGNGVNFGDTWLGDLLGFDEDGSGVQGDSLKDSLAGSRRDGKTSSSNDTSSAEKMVKKMLETKDRNKKAGLGAQTKAGSNAGTKSGFFD
jgi:hypothetical protein